MSIKNVEKDVLRYAVYITKDCIPDKVRQRNKGYKGSLVYSKMLVNTKTNNKVIRCNKSLKKQNSISLIKEIDECRRTYALIY